MKKVRIQDEFDTIDLKQSDDLFLVDSRPVEQCERQSFRNSRPQTPVTDITKTNERKDTGDSLRAQTSAVLKSILKRAHPLKKLDTEKASDLAAAHRRSDQSDISPQKTKCCPYPFVEKLKTMADKQYHKGKRNIKKITLRGDDAKIDLEEEHQKILRLKESPKAERKLFASYVVKQDSDDVLDIVELNESPSEVRRRREEENERDKRSIVVPDEIIELPSQETQQQKDSDTVSIEPTINELLEEEFKTNPPRKMPRKQKDHVYEDIEGQDPLIRDFINHLSLSTEDETISNELNAATSSTLRPIASIDLNEYVDDGTIVAGTIKSQYLLAPISSIDSTSSDEENKKRLSAILDESDQNSLDVLIEMIEPNIDDIHLKSNLKRETSPLASDKKVTFSPSTEDEPTDEPHREDVDLPEHLRVVDNRWSKMR